jgi:hypothetical protein
MVGSEAGPLEMLCVYLVLYWDAALQHGLKLKLNFVNVVLKLKLNFVNVVQ